MVFEKVGGIFWGLRKGGFGGVVVVRGAVLGVLQVFGGWVGSVARVWGLVGSGVCGGCGVNATG